MRIVDGRRICRDTGAGVKARGPADERLATSCSGGSVRLPAAACSGVVVDRASRAAVLGPAMDETRQREVIRRILRFLDQGTTELAAAPYVNAVATYTSPSRLERERALLFRREPLLLGLSRDAAERVRTSRGATAAFRRWWFARAPASCKAFVNVCRHRGAPVASGSGMAAGRFTCPYHGWVYDESGSVMAQPCARALPVFPRACSVSRRCRLPSAMD